MMLALLVKLTALSGKESALQCALEALSASSRRETGCELFHAHRVPECPGLFVLYECWRDDAALSEHNRGPSVNRFRGLLPELISADPEVSMLELIKP